LLAQNLDVTDGRDRACRSTRSRGQHETDGSDGQIASSRENTGAEQGSSGTRRQGFC
jgi:hypothetical protein